MTQASAFTSQSTTANDADRPLIWVNGQLVPKSQAAINVFDHGLLYGDGIFEGIRVYRGRIFKARQHLDRLYGCAEKIFLKIPYTKDEMLAIQRQCIEANELVEGYIRLVVTRGIGTLGLNPYSCPEPGVVCIADQIALYKPEMYEKGMRVVVANRPRIPVACLDPRIKSLNYLNNILAKCEAIHLTQELGITKPEDMLLEVVMLNVEGNVAEGSGDNIFMVKDGVVITPPGEAGILEGITRRFVLRELCPQLGFKAVERDFTLPELLEADEVFLTGSAAEIIAVREILQHEDNRITGTHKISDGEGEITGALRSRFREIVTSDQIPED
ncbi:MAG: branched-chain-amino-acid transaminase [Planctomycetota bacterium]|nr:MAG: branched-chain-amino-acid transaminase [Planctomycetota bacterium]